MTNTPTERETRKAALLKMSHADLLSIYNRYFVKKAGIRTVKREMIAGILAAEFGAL